MRLQVAAVTPQINSTKHDFFRAEVRQAADFRDDRIGRPAAAAPAHRRNHAVSATLIASVLNFQDGPGAVAFSTDHCPEGNADLRENVSGKNLGGGPLDRKR